jgi:hypothetical protein
MASFNPERASLSMESRMSFPGGIPVASDFTPGKK